MPTVSILIPVRNTARWLAQTIQSVQRQILTDWELIALDDGSTDNSSALLAGLAAREPRMRVLTREQRGLIATRNELLSMARSDYVAWLDSDDLMTPHRLALQLERFAREPGLLCLGGACTLIDPDGLPIRTHGFPTDHESILKIMEQDIAFYFPSVTMRRDAAIKIGGFREPFNICEDYDLCLRLSEIGRVGNVPEVILFYRQHMNSTVNSGRPLCSAYHRLVRELADERRRDGRDRIQRGERATVAIDKLPPERKTRAETHRRWAWWALDEGHKRTARKYALQSIRDEPLAIESWKLAACALRGR